MSGYNASYMESDELRAMGFAAVGTGVLVHRLVVIADCSNVSIGNDVRIDPFCVLSAAKITIGSNVHIGSQSNFSGRDAVEIHDHATVGHGSRVFTSVGDFSGEPPFDSLMPRGIYHVTNAPVTIAKHAIVSTGCVVMPGVTVGIGAAVGALSFVNRSLEEWAIYAGIPAKRLRDRKRDVLNHVEQGLK